MVMSHSSFPETFSNWTKDIANQSALSMGITLSVPHWQIIHALRDFYQQHHHIPERSRILVNMLSQAIGPEIGNSERLRELFPQGLVKQAFKIAGLPQPARCLEV